MSKKLSSKVMIQMHMNSQKTLDLPSKKGLIPLNNKEETDVTESALQLLKEFLNFTRVDRKHSRSEAIWVPEKHLSRLTKLAGKTCSHFGFTENGQTYLTPEESLYLLETNYLELFWNDVPFSIEQAYAVLLTSKENIDKYLTFKQCAALGYGVREPDKTVKRKCQREHSLEDKKIKFNATSSQFETLFEKIKREGPQSASIDGDYSNLYNIYLPKSSIKNCQPDFEVIHRPKGNEFSNECVSGIKSSTVTAFAGNESVSFYQFHEVDIENK